MKSGRKIAVFLIGLFLIGLVFSGCGEKSRTDPYYIIGDKDKQERLRNLWNLLEQTEVTEAEEQFSLAREIANTYARQKEYGRLVNFLGERINANPDDPYNAYYLLMIAYAYAQQEAYPVAAMYFDIIVKNYPDLLIQGQSIHFACLNQLISLVDDPHRRVKYYQELISNFPDKTDLGMDYFMLGQAYEQTGGWNLAIQAYTQFLPFIGTNIPGFPNADHYAKQIVDFNKSPKDWTFETLNGLVNTIKFVLAEGNGWQLGRYQAKVNFFVRSWAQEASDDSGMAEFNLPDFMRGTNIQYAPTLDPSSNATEAYLKTWGWNQYISTWYLYFRKIYFPLNPDIHGRWEWAGIYYGEKF
jgi:tetratricopeptide (TPR) repeat protein